jgi:hypothetical protein
MHTTGLPNGNVRAWGVGMWHFIAIWEMAGTPPQGATKPPYWTQVPPG